MIDPVPFVFKFHTLCTQFLLILILIDVQYSQKAVFSFEKGLNSQNHSSSGSNHPVKKSSKQNFRFPSPINATWKTLCLMVSKSYFASSGPRPFPGRGEYEFAFELVKLLLKIKGRKTEGLILLQEKEAQKDESIQEILGHRLKESILPVEKSRA